MIRPVKVHGWPLYSPRDCTRSPTARERGFSRALRRAWCFPGVEDADDDTDDWLMLGDDSCAALGLAAGEAGEASCSMSLGGSGVRIIPMASCRMGSGSCAPSSSRRLRVAMCGLNGWLSSLEVIMSDMLMRWSFDESCVDIVCSLVKERKLLDADLVSWTARRTD